MNNKDEMGLKQSFRKVLDKIPYVKQLHRVIADLKGNTLYPPGHFSSPVNNLETIKSMQSEIWKENKVNAIEGIDLNSEKQLLLLSELSQYYEDLPFAEKPQPGLRYYYDNTWYCYTDAIILYSMIRHFGPKRVIEIGSGFSSSVMLDTNELFFNNKIHLTFIEPNPERLQALIKEKDKDTCTIVEKEVQAIAPAFFTNLESGDILFVDSSHVVKTGSDVHYILFEILPLLKPGVLIHFHDVFFPFEYPKEWVLNGQSWNEDYFLRAFMMYNNTFEILLFSEYLHQFYGDAFHNMPLCYKNQGGNFWIVKK